MEENKNQLMLLISDHKLKVPQGVKAFKNGLVFMWCTSTIFIYETPTIESRKAIDENERTTSKKRELNLRNDVKDIFQRNETVFALDESGNLYSLQLTNQVNLMEVDDLFSSPVENESTPEWEQTLITKLNECEKVKTVCYLSSSLALLAVKDEHLRVVVYSLPECNLNCVMNLKRYNCQDAVLSSCVVSLMSPKLKQNFKENLEPFDEEIIIIALASGLVVWFCVKNPSKGPFVLCNTYQSVQNMFFIKDSNSGLYSYLMVILSSGQIVAFGSEKYLTLCLPDSVKSSTISNNFIISSNFVDCYASEIQMGENVSVNCVLLPVKGVCAMTSAPDSDKLLIAATNHGSVYCFDPTCQPPENSYFTLPDQSLLDNMFVQSQILDSLYKKMSHEENILKAVSATIAESSCKHLLQATVHVNSDDDFTVTAKLEKSKITFLCALWSVCVETITEDSDRREISFHKMEHDFSSNNDLVVNVKRTLTVGDVVSIELVYFIDKKQPVLVVPVDKVAIDACDLMCSQLIARNTTKTEESLENILTDVNQAPLQTLRECNLVVNLPTDFPVNTFFKTILSSSQHRFDDEEWDKMTSGRKLNVSVSISGSSVLLKLNAESRELIISSSCTKLCHQVKKAVATRLKQNVKKCISENLTLDLQAIYQSFEIESLKEKPNYEALDSLRKNVRDSISAKLTI